MSFPTNTARKQHLHTIFAGDLSIDLHRSRSINLFGFSHDQSETAHIVNSEIHQHSATHSFGTCRPTSWPAHSGRMRKKVERLTNVTALDSLNYFPDCGTEVHVLSDH